MEVFVQIKTINKKIACCQRLCQHGGSTLEVEKVLGKLRKTPFQSLKEEQEEFMNGGDVIVDK
jgi:hypothetical protein